MNDMKKFIIFCNQCKFESITWENTPVRALEEANQHHNKTGHGVQISEKGEIMSSVDKPTVRRFAEEAYLDSEGSQIDPITISILITIIISVVKLIMECRKNKRDGRNLIRGPYFWRKWQLERHIDAGNYAIDSDLVVEMLLKRGKRTTDEEVEALYNECK